MILIIGILCASMPILTYDQETKSARVIIYQEGNYGGHRFGIWVDDKPLMSIMPRNTSIEFQYPPGDIEILIKRTRYLQRSNSYVIKLEAGVTYYLRLEVVYEFPLTSMKLSVANSVKYKRVEKKLKKVLVGETHK